MAAETVGSGNLDIDVLQRTVPQQASRLLADSVAKDG
jgi:hypothetical protein